jgi:aminoglycoside N3'-acetyltransferase
MSGRFDLPEKAEIDKNQLVKDLKNMGIIKGDHVAVALSFKSIGFVKGGPDAFIDALLDVVGSEGTVFMNAHTLAFPLSEIDPTYVFDPESTPPVVGLVPNVFWKRKGSIRSRHPTCSIVAFGRLAKHFTEGHDEHSRAYLPYERQVHVDGKFLFIGTDDRLVGVRHEAQRRAGLFIVPTTMGVQYKNLNGKVNLFFWVFPPCAKKLPEMMPKLEKMGVAKRGMIGRAHSIVCSAKLLDAITGILKENPTIDLCDDILCTSCREIERRMNLYGRIEAPRFFQRSRLIRRILYFRNKVVLKRYDHVSFRRRPTRKRIFHPDAVLEIAIRRFMLIVSRILGSR